MTLKNQILIYILILSALLIGLIATASFWQGLGRGLSVLYSITTVEPTPAKLAEDRGISKEVVKVSPIVDTEVAIVDYTPAFNPLETPEDIKLYIRERAPVHGVDPELAIGIAKCESNFRNVCNERYGCRSGISIFQIVKTTFDEQCEGDVYDVKDNIDCALKMMSRGEYWRWDSSSKCWSK